ncbi:MAG: acyl-CoA dehydrogenase family protein [Geobacteraceae bacterium]
MNFEPATLSDKEDALRGEVRSFLDENRHLLNTSTAINSWSVSDPEFSRLLGKRGWIGMTWPKRYGGGERSYLERYVVTEELLAAGAPVGAHWFADRQTGPLLLRFGTEEQKSFFLPRMVRGDCFFAIGMSEPNSGSDLASIQTKAKRVDGGWEISGQKIWTSIALSAHYMVLLCRTAPPSEDRRKRHEGMSQFVVDLGSEGITRRPIRNLSGEEHFCEVFFDNVFVPDERLLGKENDGWNQVMAELAFERSGPERFLTNHQLMVEALEVLREAGSRESSKLLIGQLTARLMVLRQMSLSVASQLQTGALPVTEASIVKDLGTSFEQELAESLRTVLAVEPGYDADERIGQLLGSSILQSPSFSLRGGTREILRGILAKGLGLR